MSAPGRVVVVDDLLTDVVVHLPGPLVTAVAHGSDTPSRTTVKGGGSAANVAAWLAHAGVATTLVARVGDDPAGRDRVAELRAAGVDPQVAVDPTAPTGTVVVLVDPDGERTMLPDRGAGRALTLADVDAALAVRPDVRHLHLSGYVLLDEGCRPAGLHALAVAGARGLGTSVGAASAAPLRAVGAEAFLHWTAGTGLLVANAAEAAVLAGVAEAAVEASAAEAAVLAGAAEAGVEAIASAAARDASTLAARTGASVVVTAGAAGATWSDPAGSVWCAAGRAVPLDTTGAGDAFTAGLLAARLSGADPAGALRAGLDRALLSLGTLGGRPGAPAAGRLRGR